MGFWAWVLIAAAVVALAVWLVLRDPSPGRHRVYRDDHRYRCERLAQRVRDWWAWRRARR